MRLLMSGALSRNCATAGGDSVNPALSRDRRSSQRDCQMRAPCPELPPSFVLRAPRFCYCCCSPGLHRAATVAHRSQLLFTTFTTRRKHPFTLRNRIAVRSRRRYVGRNEYGSRSGVQFPHGRHCFASKEGRVLLRLGCGELCLCCWSSHEAAPHTDGAQPDHELWPLHQDGDIRGYSDGDLPVLSLTATSAPNQPPNTR
jgi:hypothetical protein